MSCLSGKLSLLLLLGLLIVHFNQINADSSSQEDNNESNENEGSEEEDGCLDLALNCNQIKQAGLCDNRIYRQTILTYCRETCDICGDDTVIGGDSNDSSNNQNQANCRDTASSCFNWNRNGYCDSAFYTTAQKQASCAKTCGLC